MVSGSTQTAPAPPARRGSVPSRLVRGELLKIWTTNMWWILAICALVGLALALLVNAVQAHFEIGAALNPPDFTKELGPNGQPPSQQDIQRLQAEFLAQNGLQTVLLRSAANIFTSGQFFGLMLVMLLGILLITNEFFHQTATATFLTTPKRTEVILAKLAAAVGIATAAWVVTTLINLGVGALIFSGEGQPNSLGVWSVERAILVNLPAYAIWAVFGVGLGVLIRSQIGATITGILLYTVGTVLGQLFFNLIFQFVIKDPWVLQAQVAVPAVSSQVMVSAEPLVLGYSDKAGVIYGPQWWVGAVILVGYGVLAAGIGTLLIRRRDIS